MDFPSVFDFRTLDGRNGFTIKGVLSEPDFLGTSDRAGADVSIAGDINGDGIDDLIIGAPEADPNGIASGASYVVFGSRDGFGESLELSGLDGINGFVINGVSGFSRGEDGNLSGDDDRAGASVSGAGDINNDGIDDLIINASGVNTENLSTGDLNGAGESYVVFGSRTGFAPSLELSNLDGSNGFTLKDVNGGLGVVDVSSAGDINNDGIDDIIVGAPGTGARFAGKSYIVFGQADGFEESIELDSLDGTNGFAINGSYLFDEAGSAVSAAGDINNDGIDDIIIGAPGAAYSDTDSSLVSNGESYVVFGRGSSFGASLDLSSLDGSNGFTIRATPKPEAIGSARLGAAVSGAGDVNGDGLDDILIGAPQTYGKFIPGRFTVTTVYAGESYVVFGSAAGFGASLDVTTLNGNNGFSINNGLSINNGFDVDTLDQNDRIGSEVSAAGDVNNDGIDDFIVGSELGQDYVIFGSREGFGASFDLTSIDGKNGFGAGAYESFDSGESATGGDLNGDGISDLIVGETNLVRNSQRRGGAYVLFGRSSESTDIPIAKGLLATIYVDATGTVVGNAFEATESYQGRLTSNTDDTDHRNDVIVGTEGDDNIWAGTQGKDIVIGGAGADTIGINSENIVREINRDGTYVDAGDGDDFVYSTGDGNNLHVVDLGSGNDRLWNNGFGSSIVTGTGDNLIGTGFGSTVTTGAGNDFFYNTDNFVNGGSNTVDLGDGNNTIWIDKGANYDITTGSGDDIIGMGSQIYTVDAGDGNNVVYTVAPVELDRTKAVTTGAGDDYIQTGNGDDLLNGGGGLNTLYGGAGADTFTISTDAYNFLGDFELGIDRIQLADTSFGELSFYQGSVADGNASSTFIFAGSVGIAEVTDSTVTALNSSVNFV